jgi:lysophospholipase L1-like esterase
LPALLLVVCFAGHATAGQESQLYLALGDSLAAGVGASEPEETGYVGLVYDALLTDPAFFNNLTLMNLGIPGETTTSMLANGQMGAALSQIEGRREDGIAGNEVAVITIDIGANDFIPLVVGDSPCVPNPLAEACTQAATAALDTFRTNFADIMRRLRAAAGPDTEIVALGLYNPLSGSGGSFDAIGDAAVGLFNDTVAEFAIQDGIRASFADVFPQFQDRGSELTHIAETPSDVHPNDAGHYMMARVVVEALGLPPETVPTPASGAPALRSPTPTRPPGTPPAATPSATADLPPSAGEDEDNDMLWPYAVAATAIVVLGGMLTLLWRRRR